MTKYFAVPFASSGNKTAVPDASQPSGDVSYTDGWTPDYEADQTTDPSAKDVSRQAENQLKFDITEAIKEIQETGILPYRADVNYPINATVTGSDGNLYKAYIANGPGSSVVNPVGDVTGTWYISVSGNTYKDGDFLTYGGTADALVLTSENSQPIQSLKDGIKIRFRPTATNTGAITINADGTGLKAGVTIKGVAMPAGYLQIGIEVSATYDLSNDNWIVDRVDEIGINAEGEYLKLANGVVLFWGLDSADPLNITTLVNNSYFGEIAVIYPIAALTIPDPSVTCETTGSVTWSNAVAPTTSGFTARVICAASVSQATTVRWSAIGRWY